MKTILKLNSKMPFGKFKGITVKKLISRKETSYLNWFKNTVTICVFAKDVKKKIVALKTTHTKISSGGHFYNYNSQMDNDYAENGMSLQDMGYDGDGAW